MRALLRGIFEAKNAEMVLGRTPLSRRARALLPNQEIIVAFGEGGVCECAYGILVMKNGAVDPKGEEAKNREKWRTPSCSCQCSKTTRVILSTLKWHSPAHLFDAASELFFPQSGTKSGINGYLAHFLTAKRPDPSTS